MGVSAIASGQNYYINANTRQITSNIKNTALKDKSASSYMSDELTPVDDLEKALKTPLKLANRFKVNRGENAIDFAEGSSITMEAGYHLTVTQTGIQISGGDLQNQEARQKASDISGALTTLIRNANGTLNTTAYSKSQLQEWSANVEEGLAYFGIDASKDFTVNGAKYTHDEDGNIISQKSIEAMEAYEAQKNANRTITQADEKTQNRIISMTSYYLDGADSFVVDAWKKAMQECDFNPFQTEAGTANTLMQLSVEQDFATNGNDKLFGNTVSDAYEAVQNILNRIENPLGEVSAQYSQDEKQFYETFAKNLQTQGMDQTEESNINVSDSIEKSLQSLGPNAPEEVKQAWREAAEETGTNGMGMMQNGMVSHITQMSTQKAIAWIVGDENYSDVLGNSVESAISAAQKALYDLENPLPGNDNRSPEVQQWVEKEKEFYQKFIEKLQK